MNNLSIKQKVFIMFALMGFVVIASGVVIFNSLNKAAEDADITNALGRQRMLSQAMAKSALGNAMAKSRRRTIEQNVQSLNHYITQMRAIFTKDIVSAARKVNLGISMDPASEKHPAIPFPATFTRMVNEKFGENQFFKIDIINKDPVNPQKNLKSEIDHRAYDFLTASPEKIFSEVQEQDGKLYIGLYTSDRATVPACANCHAALKGKKFEVGDMLGIRKFLLMFSEDVQLGHAELNPNLSEYQRAKDIFDRTILAVKDGGEYPLDLAMTSYKTVNAIPNDEIQNKIREVIRKFKEFVGHVNTLMSVEVNSLPYRKAQQDIVESSNNLRKLNDDLVDFYTKLANRNQATIKWTVIIAIILTVVIIIGIYYYFASKVVRPIISISGKMQEISKGNFVQEKLSVESADEIGELQNIYNTLLDTMKEVVNQAEDIASGNLSKQYEMKGDLAHAFGKMTQELRDKQEADRKFKEMSEERHRQAEDLQRKVDSMLEVVSSAADGDLTRQVTVTGESAIGQMGEGLIRFFDQLVDSMQEISRNANDLATSASEISAAVQDQAAVSAEQSTSVTEISTTVEELSISSSQVADNANSVAQISTNALRESERGMEAMENLKIKMDTISDDNKGSIQEIVDLGTRSEEIGKVMEIINNIADQTKLIAFNAAIEASSAGEAGKRFGVVAVEIRRLADNVMESTGEIENKIEEIQQAINRLVINSERGSKNIKDGTELTRQTIRELENLVTGAKTTADAAAQISLSTQQQKTATDQVLAALKEIVDGSRQSSAAIKQTSSVTSKLSEMSSHLKNLVGRFRINQNH
ncbi:MAG: HAMP domain-containing protein [Nitrospina sp.]|nr:HAMP domain-containing protein [Nitrospina sp.]